MSLEIAKRIAQLIPSNSVDEIKRLLSPYSLEQRRFIMSTDVSGSSFLYYAVAHRSPLVMKYFLEECEADPNSLGSEQCGKQTCLSKAASLDSKIMAEILLARGADINGVSFGYETALNIACMMDSLKMVRFFIKNGSNDSIECGNGNDSQMPLDFDCVHPSYRKVNGVNINQLDERGNTLLMQAITLSCTKIIYFLLTLQDVKVRLKNQYNEDVLTMTIRFCRSDVAKKIIKRCGFSKEEVIRASELESIFEYIYGRYSKSKVLWKNTLRLRGLPLDTPIFYYQLPIQTSDNDINLFRENHRQALLYMRMIYGPRHILKLKATIIAWGRVNIRQNFHKIYESFSKILYSLNCKEFLQIQEHIENVFLKYIDHFSEDEESIENLFNMLHEHALILRGKHHQPMSTWTRKFYETRFDGFLVHFLSLIELLKSRYKFPIDIISKELKNFMKLHLKNSTIAWMCLEGEKFSVFEIFLSCGYDVNKTNENKETILHYLLDSKFTRKRELIKLVVDAGFDFSRVTSKKYCLLCRMKKEGFLYYPEECNTLQCLAANVICEKTVFMEINIPAILKTIIKTHMHIS